jgi:hypothetical protein
MSNFVLEKSMVNNIVVTVSERSQLLNPFFLIVFKSKFSIDDYFVNCSLQNSVASNVRYDLLVITEVASPDPLLGEVYLLEGEWSYEIYESEIQTLLIEETTVRVLQRGFIVVK